MVIRGKEYQFAYTIGAFSKFQDMKLDQKSSGMQLMIMAVVMNAEFNNMNRIDNPDFDAPDLTLEEVQSLKFSEYSELEKEILGVIKADSAITVEVKAKKGVKKNQVTE